ncbi:MAG: hypothetical protein ACLRFJ_04030 [Alphaproteobacteria bacterium]
MISWHLIFISLKYTIGIVLLLIIVLAPVWIATQTKKSKTTMIFTRILSWLFGWTGIGWLLSLFVSSKK